MKPCFRFWRCARPVVVCGLAGILLAGCAGTSPTLPPLGEELEETTAPSTGSGAINGAGMPDAPDEADPRPEARLFPGTDRAVRLPPEHEPVTIRGEAVKLNFVDAPLEDVVEAILGDLLELPYSIDGPLEGEVTLQTHAPVSRDALPDLLDSMLRVNNALMLKDEDGIFRVGPPGMLEGLASQPRRMGHLPPGQNLVIVPLDYVGAQEMAGILEPVAPEGAIVHVDRRRNLLMLAGSRNQIEGWFELVRSFDVDYLEGMSVGVFPLEYASAGEVSDALATLLAEAEGEEGGVAAAIRAVPIDRLNSLLVVTPQSRYLEYVETWVRRLDNPQDSARKPRLYVYPVQNGSAGHLAELLGALYGDGAPTGGGRGEEGRVAPGLTPTRIDSDGEGDADRGSSGGGSAGQGADGGPTVAGLGDDVRIIADERNNALLIMAPRRDYRKIEDALQSLDRMPAQVVIEASIVEVTLTDELRYGLEWFFTSSSGEYTGEGALNLNQNGSIGAEQPGFSFKVTNPAGEVRAVLNALADKSLVNVLSNPTLMVLDNHSARIQVGDEQPVRSTETVTDGGTRSSSIEFRDTGVILEVTPSVNAGGMITLDVSQEVTDVGQVDSATGQRSFLQRNVQSRVAVRSGESVVLGGLIRDNRTNARSGVPGLHDLPVLGHLFGRTSVTGQRTELLVMITPRVLRNEYELRAVGEELRERMRGLRTQFGGRAAAGPDDTDQR